MDDAKFIRLPPPWYSYIVEDATRAYYEAVALDGINNVNIGYYIDAAIEKALAQHDKMAQPVPA